MVKLLSAASLVVVALTGCSTPAVAADATSSSSSPSSSSSLWIDGSVASTASSMVSGEAECQSDDVDKLSALTNGMSLYDWCSVAPNMTSEEKSQWCLTACAYAASSLMDSIPDCTHDGVNAYELLTDLEAGCDAVSTEDSLSDESDDLGDEYDGSDLFGSGYGGECTSDQISELLSVMEDTITGSGCADMQSELADASTTEVCASPCWSLIEEHFDDFPDCDYEGINLHSQFQQAMDQCASMTGNGAEHRSSVSDVTAAGIAAASVALALYAL